MGNLKRVPGIINLRRDEISGIFYTVIRHNGKLTTRSLDTKSKSTARLLHAQKMAEILGEHDKVRAVSVSEVLQRYAEWVNANPDYKPTTKLYRRETLTTVFKTWPELGQMNAAEVSQADCEGWRDRFLQKGGSAPRFNGALVALRGLFRHAMTMGLRKDNPAQLLKARRVRPKKLNLPTKEEFSKLIENIRAGGCKWSRHAADLVEFLAYSGCRIGEAAHVMWRDVDFKAKSMVIRGDPETGTKGGGIRTIPLYPALEELLLRMPRTSPHVLHTRSCYSGLRRACQVAGISHLTHHDLRHLFATRCLQSGVDVPTVSRWLGHKDGGVLVLQTYSEYCSAHSQAMAQKVVLK